jgi:hypothetical protein
LDWKKFRGVKTVAVQTGGITLPVPLAGLSQTALQTPSYIAMDNVMTEGFQSNVAHHKAGQPYQW